MNIYDFKVNDINQNEVSLEKYRGKVLLIVNTATKCGLTPHYEGLEALYKKYKDRGFEVLDFPCNQFLSQAPGTDKEISDFCTSNYGTTFTTFSKIEVNGDNAHPLYKYLKETKVDDIEDSDTPGFKEKLKELSQVVLGNGIKWNFTKFLVDKNGNVVARYAPTRKPQDLETDIEKLLNN